MTINNRGLSGNPVLPYVDFRSYAGSDLFFDLAFLDHTAAGVTPTIVTYRIDDLTNSLSMVPLTNLGALAATMLVQIPASKWVMSYPYQGSQLCQITWTFTALDSVTSTSFTATLVTIVELIAIQTPT